MTYEIDEDMSIGIDEMGSLAEMMSARVKMVEITWSTLDYSFLDNYDGQGSCWKIAVDGDGDEHDNEDGLGPYLHNWAVSVGWYFSQDDRGTFHIERKI